MNIGFNVCQLRDWDGCLPGASACTCTLDRSTWAHVTQVVRCARMIRLDHEDSRFSDSVHLMQASNLVHAEQLVHYVFLVQPNSILKTALLWTPIHWHSRSELWSSTAETSSSHSMKLSFSTTTWQLLLATFAYEYPPRRTWQHHARPRHACFATWSQRQCPGKSVDAIGEDLVEWIFQHTIIVGISV